MDHFLKRLDIARFRGLEKLTLPNFGAVNLVVGQNNSGKTSVLEALMLILRPGDSRNWVNLLAARDASGGGQSRQQAVEWLYPVEDRREPVVHHPIELSCIVGNGSASLLSTLLRKPAVNADTEPEDSPDISIEYSSPGLGTDTTRSGAIRFAPAPIRGTHAPGERVYGPRIDSSIRSIPGTKIELAKAHGHRTSRASLRTLVNAIEGNYATSLREILQDFDDDIVGIVRPTSGPTRGLDFVEHRRLGLVPLDSFGDGVRKVAYLLDKLLRAQDGILLIDEIEVAFHPAVLAPLCANLRSFARELNVQIIATTHSLEAVDAVLRAFDDSQSDLTAFRLEREPHLTARRFDGAALHDLRHVLGQEIR